MNITSTAFITGSKNALQEWSPETCDTSIVSYKSESYVSELKHHVFLKENTSKESNELLVIKTTFASEKKQFYSPSDGESLTNYVYDFICHIAL